MNTIKNFDEYKKWVYSNIEKFNIIKNSTKDIEKKILDYHKQNKYSPKIQHNHPYSEQIKTLLTTNVKK